MSDWADNKIGAEGARALGDALKENITLTKLDLDRELEDHKIAAKEQGKHSCGVELLADNKIGVEGARALSDALKTNLIALPILNLSCKQENHKRSKAATVAWGDWQSMKLVMKEPEHWVMHSRSTQH